MAEIERGTVAEVLEGSYKVQSLDRPGIATPPICAIGTETYNTGDRVYFFLFPDGDGKILSRM